MQEKLRFFIIIGLVGILGVNIFTNFKIYNAKKELERERDQLKSENNTLSKKIEEVIQEKNQAQEKISALNKDFNKLSQEKADIQRRYEVINKEREGLSEDLSVLQSENKRLSSDLTQMGREKQKLNEQLEADLKLARSANLTLKRQLKSLSGRKAKLESELGVLQEEKSELASRLSEAGLYPQEELPEQEKEEGQEEKGQSDNRSAEAVKAPRSKQEGKTYIELPPIVVRSQANVPAAQKKAQAGAQEGRVLDVNKANNFVVIDLGQDAGTKVGQNFGVYRKDKRIASIEVIQVRKSIAACDIKEQTTPISEGDIIR